MRARGLGLASGFMRRVVETCLGVLLAAMLLGGWLLSPYEIAGSSMAPTLLGAHRDVVCRECGIGIAIDGLIPLAAGQRAACPNCGSLETAVEDFFAAGGERVVVDRTAYYWRAPRRWDVVALRDPSGGKTAVKRVVGLPGEAIALRGGDVYVDGQVARKSLAEQWSMAVLVHDDAYLPPAGSPFFHRWRPQRQDAWRRQRDGGWLHAHGERADKIDWLVYRHVRHAPGDPRRAVAGPIDDTLPFNQPLPVFDARSVGDLLLECHVTAGAEQALWLAIDAHDGRYIAQLDLRSGSATLTRGQRVLTSQSSRRGQQVVDALRSAEPVHVQWSLVDRRVLLAVEGMVVLQHDLPSSNAAAGPPLPRLAVGTRGGGARVSGLRVLRDVYYRHDGLEPAQSSSGSSTAAWKLGDDELFLLGDNPRRSSDSRRWHPREPVALKSLIGKPLMVYLGFRPVAVGTRRIEVPDFSAIRYIP